MPDCGKHFFNKNMSFFLKKSDVRLESLYDVKFIVLKTSVLIKNIDFSQVTEEARCGLYWET